MLNVILTVLATLAVLGLARLALRAAWRGRLGGRRPAWMARRLARRLEASPEQERVLLEEMEALRSSLAELRRDLLVSRQDLAGALSAQALDPAAVDALFARAGSRLEALRARLGAALARIHGALDPRQRQLLAELVRSGPHCRRAHGHA